MNIQRTTAKTLLKSVALLIFFSAMTNVSSAKLQSQLHHKDQVVVVANVTDTNNQGLVYQTISQELKDKKLAGKIRSSIAFERRLSNKQLSVEVNRGTVRVTGKLHKVKEQETLWAIIHQAAGKNATLSMSNLIKNLTE